MFTSTSMALNISLSFSQTELKGQGERDTNLRRQSSKAGSAVTAEGLGAEEVTLAVTEAVSPNPCCFGTLDKDQWRHADRWTRWWATEAVLELRRGFWRQHSWLGDSKQLATLNFLKTIHVLGNAAVCLVLDDVTRWTSRRWGEVLLFNVGKYGLSCTKRRKWRRAFPLSPGESEDEKWE